MRIYSSCSEAIREVERDIYEMGIVIPCDTMQDKVVAGDPDFETMELQNYCFTVLDTSDRGRILEYMRPDDLAIEWAEAEFKERMSENPVNPGEAWKLRRDVWEEFIHKGKFAYTYNERIREQLVPVCEELKRRHGTRQAVIQIHNEDDYLRMGAVARIPCSMHYQFMVRKEKLFMTYVMRSTDYITHFAYDLWLAMAMQSSIAKFIGIPIGDFCFFTSSLHMYRKDAREGVF